MAGSHSGMNGAPIHRSVSSLTIGGLSGAQGGGANPNQQQQQSLQQQVQQSSTDEEMAFVDAVLSRVFNNLALFKLKLMDSCGMPLSDSEALTVLEGAESDPTRVAGFKEALRLVQDALLAKRKASIGLSQLTHMGSMFGGGGGTVGGGLMERSMMMGMGMGGQSNAGNLTGRHTTRSDRSAGLARTSSLYGGGGGGGADTSSSTPAGALIPSFASGVFAPISGAEGGGGGGGGGGFDQSGSPTTTVFSASTAFGGSPNMNLTMRGAGGGSSAGVAVGATAHTRRVSTMQHQIREQSAAASELVRSQIDSMFRFTLEDFTLRYQTQRNADEAKLAPRRMLDAAVGEQRTALDTAAAALRAEKQLTFALSNKVKEMEVSIKTRDEVHKQRLDGFLREVCILKEQLFRSYRDKNYVGKPVDLMTAVEDTETGEDVSIDQLLEYRKQVKVSEKQIAEARAKVRQYEEELKDKEEAMRRIEDRARNKEASVATIKKEMDKINALAISQREELRVLRAENARLKGETAVDTAHRGVQATEERDEAAAYAKHFDNASVAEIAKNQTMISSSAGGASNNSNSNSGSSPSSVITLLGILQRLDEAMSSSQREAAERSELSDKLQNLRETINEEFKAAITLAEKQRDEAVKARDETAARAANAVRIASEAEAAIDVATYRAAEEVIALSEELRTAQNAVHVLRLKAVAVARAHLSLATRYQVLKTANGLDDYKKKANSFHFARAEVAVRTAQANVAEVRRQCAAEVKKATERVKAIEERANEASALLEGQAGRHYEEMRTVQLRVTAIENASRLLLADYERLRDEHFKLMLASSSSANTNNNQNQQVAGGGSGGSNNTSTTGGGAGAGSGLVDSPRSRPGSSRPLHPNTSSLRPSSGAGGGVRKTAAPLPPSTPTAASPLQQQLPQQQPQTAAAAAVGLSRENSSFFSAPDTALLGSASFGGSAPNTAIAIAATPTTGVTAVVRRRERLPLHSALEAVLDAVDERNGGGCHSAGGGGGAGDSSITTIATSTSSPLLAAAALPYNPEKLRHHAYGGGGQQQSPSSLAAPNTSSTPISYSNFKGASAALPPLPPQALLASSVLQVEAALATLITQMLGNGGPVAASATVAAGSSTSAAADEEGGEKGGGGEAPHNRFANPLAQSLIDWAGGAAARTKNNGAVVGSSKNNNGDGGQQQQKALEEIGSGDGAIDIGGGRGGEEGDARALAAMAAASWSRLRAIMPAYHALKVAIARIGAVSAECPAMKLPKLHATIPIGAASLSTSTLPPGLGGNSSSSTQPAAAAAQQRSTVRSGSASPKTNPNSSPRPAAIPAAAAAAGTSSASPQQAQQQQPRTATLFSSSPALRK